MKTSMHTMYLEELGPEGAVKTLKDAGFDCYAFSLNTIKKDEESIWNKPDYLERAQKLKAYADSIGITCNQTHAPYLAKADSDEIAEKLIERTHHSIEISAALGAEAVVVHPCHAKYPHRENRAKLKQLNYDLYMRYAETAAKAGIKIALENMWQRNSFSKNIVDSCCSSAEEFCEYLDMLPSDIFTANLDIGHCFLTGSDPVDMIHALGSRLTHIHAHDNDYKDDLHTAFFMGKIDYEPIFAALKSVGYKGDFTLETLQFVHKLPMPLRRAGLTFLAQQARYLVNTYWK